MSPTIFIYRNYRFFFFSREEKRLHVHIVSPNGEAKFWMEPYIELAHSVGYSSKELNELREIVKKRNDEISKKWEEHFGS